MHKVLPLSAVLPQEAIELCEYIQFRQAQDLAQLERTETEGPRARRRIQQRRQVIEMQCASDGARVIFF
jgi:hypothetical protein